MQHSSTSALSLTDLSEQHNKTTGWLSCKGFSPTSNTPFILYANQSGMQFFSTSYNKLSPIIRKGPLIAFIKENKLFSYHIVCWPLKAAVKDFNLTATVSMEINVLLSDYPSAQAMYVVAHKTGGHEKLVAIGGDCYRPDRGDLYSILTRTKDLATGMLRKSSLIFPDIPALTGGKKGEFDILDNCHQSISKVLSEEAIYQLSEALLPVGIQFINRKTSPLRKFLKPNSLSPDAFTGRRWKRYVKAWMERGIDPHEITCIPSDENPSSSAVPTAVGVIATTYALANKLLSKRFAESRFLLEGYGEVGSNSASLLIKAYGVPRDHITVIDPNPEACESATNIGLHSVCMEANSYYRLMAARRDRYDIWINNGIGDTVGVPEVMELLNSGIQLFIGGANNLFLVSELDMVLDLISKNNAYAFPDYACSGGGWTMAVLEQIRKATGKHSTDALQVIRVRNVKMVNDALEGFKPGMDLWRRVAAQADITVSNILQRQTELSDTDFEIKNWTL